MTGLSTLSCPSCDEGLLLPPGTLIDGRYEIENHLAKGGMGTVFRAHDRDLDQDVAIKFLRTSRHPEATARFKAEIKLARKVKHENVCAIWQNGYLDGVAYFVMELVEGRNLRDLVLEQGPVAAAQACQLVLEAAAGLRAIHEAGVIHRDVKSPNLMLDARGVVRVVDFGIAKRDPTRAGPDLTLDPRTATNQIVGSPEYMSPEQVRGLPLDARTDIYSLGIVLYELCLGRVPFRGTSAFDTMMMHVQADPVLEGPAVHGVASALLPILRRALTKVRDDRYSTMRALMSDLRRVQAGFEARGTESYPRTIRQQPWRRIGQAVVAGLALGGAALVVREIVRSGSEQGPPEATATTVSTASPAPLPSPSARVELSATISLEPSPRPQGPSPARRIEDKSLASGSSLPAVRKETQRAPRLASGGGSSQDPPPQVPGDTPAPSILAAAPSGATPDQPAGEPSRTGSDQVSSAGAPPSPTSRPVEEEVQTVPPVCQRCPVPYPPGLERLGLEGTVEVRILVNEHGRVEEREVVGTARRELRDAALEAVKKWIYRPATRAGVPVRTYVNVRVTFRLGPAS